MVLLLNTPRTTDPMIYDESSQYRFTLAAERAAYLRREIGAQAAGRAIRCKVAVRRASGVNRLRIAEGLGL